MAKVTTIENNRGFTIIELIVAIAIIAILSAIVLSNVMPYQNKGKDAAIKGQAGQISIAAADFYYTYGTFSGMCGTGTKCLQIESTISNLGGTANLPKIKSDGTVYCMDFFLSDGTSKWCVDNTGYSGPLDSCTSSYFACQ